MYIKTWIKYKIISKCVHVHVYMTVYVCVDVSGESCWWTIHPASKQRSEGEKVRVGDDLILVSVASERYLVSISYAGTCTGKNRKQH